MLDNVGSIVIGASAILLIVLFYVIKLQNGIMEKLDGPKQDKVESKPVVQAPVASQAVQGETDDEELIAVITAAIAAALGRHTSQLIVRSIRPLDPGAHSWAVAGRQEQMNSKF